MLAYRTIELQLPSWSSVSRVCGDPCTEGLWLEVFEDYWAQRCECEGEESGADQHTKFKIRVSPGLEVSHPKFPLA